MTGKKTNKGMLPKKFPALKAAVVLLLIVIAALFPAKISRNDLMRPQSDDSLVQSSSAPVWRVEVVKAYPHDPDAFTQGLFFHEGFLYESTGRYGKSALLKKDLQTGKTLASVELDDRYFGEGAVLLNDRIYQLTWQNETLLVYDARTFALMKKIRYSGEGWGLVTDGKHLLQSDGSATLTVHDPESFKIVRKISVRDGDRPIDRLNELEVIGGEIWANIFMEDLAVRIHPETGEVLGWIDLSPIRAHLPPDTYVDVINGIACDEATGRIFITGKFWPLLFEVRLVQ